MTPNPTEGEKKRESTLDKKAEPGAASWRMDAETQVLPKNRLSIVFVGLMACFFLSAVDQTIIATAPPRRLLVSYEVGPGGAGAYLLSSASLAPLYGKLSDLIGRKPILYTSIAFFLFESALCGSAQNMTWLIASRAVQGIGGGGII